MTFDEPLRRAFATLTERLQDDVRHHVQIAVDEALAALADREPPVPPPSIDRVQPENPGAIARLADGVRSIGRARSLSETLDTLASCAAREAARVAVLTIRGSRLHGWRFIGFGALDNDPAVDLSSEESGLIAVAVETKAAASGSHPPSFAGAPADTPCVALPIALSGEIVAVLYADNGSSRPDSPTAQPASHALLRSMLPMLPSWRRN